MSKIHSSVLIVDYGMGNLFSIQRVIKHLGAVAEISQDPKIIFSAERIILPGVGAFGDGMNELKIRNLIDPIKDFIASGKPLLGICLGMQLLMEESDEFGINNGLGIIPGVVKKMSIPYVDGQSYKIPHVGWNKLFVPHSQSSVNAANYNDIPKQWNNTIFNNLSEGAFVYFTHSYVAEPSCADSILAETVYGNERFCSAIVYKNVSGCQFHPEISGETGLSIIRNFLN